MANSYSGGDRRLKQTSAVFPPSNRIKHSPGLTRIASLLLRCTPAQRLMNTTAVVTAAEFLQFPLHVERIPEEQAIEKLAANGADQPFHKRMRNWYVGNRLDLVDLKHAQVGEPAVKTKQRVVIGADVLR